MNEYLIQSYYDWLMDSIDFDDKVNMYEHLLEHLFNRDYIWLENIPLDANRAADGLSLRREFGALLDEQKKQEFFALLADKKCSLLEMFIALADRLTQLVSLEKYEFFWMFIDNLGLGWATVYDYDMDIVDGILTDFIYGTVHGEEPKGNENPPVLFPCREVYANMNDDLYMQANLYLKSYFL